MFRILTEDKNRDGILGILDSHVDGYTVTSTQGSWKGQRENSLAIDLIDTPRETVFAIAQAIKVANKQESVLVYEVPVTSTFV